MIGSVADLMWVVNQDSVELHPWQSRADHLHEPDLVVFDLDPGQGTPFERTCEAALVIKEVMDQLGLACQAKTTGGKGIHVIAGIEPELDHEVVRQWVITVAAIIRQHRGDLFTTDYAHHRRAGKVLLDYNQNGYRRSTAGIYSVRPDARRHRLSPGDVGGGRLGERSRPRCSPSPRCPSASASGATSPQPSRTCASACRCYHEAVRYAAVVFDLFGTLIDEDADAFLGHDAADGRSTRRAARPALRGDGGGTRRPGRSGHTKA